MSFISYLLVAWKSALSVRRDIRQVSISPPCGFLVRLHPNPSPSVSVPDDAASFTCALITSPNNLEVRRP